LESLIPLAELICNNYQGQISPGVGNEYEVQEMDRAAEGKAAENNKTYKEFHYR